jgi:hypothetical protein
VNCRLPRSGEAFLTVTPFGQTWFCDRDAVLDKNLSLIDVHPRLEDDVDWNPSVSRRLRGADRWLVRAIEVDHDFGIDPGRSWSLRGRFPLGLSELGLAFLGHESARATKLYDRTGDEITLDEIERIAI